MNEIILTPHRSEHEIARVAAFIKHCMPGKRLRITVQAAVKERTSPQCRYLNGVAYKIVSEATGYERDEVSEWCCGTYFGWKQVKCPKSPSNPEGVKDVPLRTTTRNADGKREVLPWDQFAEYVAWMQRFFAQKGLFIPDPDQEYKQEAA